MLYKIWVKYGDDFPPIKVKFDKEDVDDLKTEIKEKLSNQLNDVDVNQIALRRHGEKDDLDPELKVDESFVNTSQTPIQVLIDSKNDNKGIDEEIQEKDWKWQCFEEEREYGCWGNIIRNPSESIQEQQSDVVPFEVVYFKDEYHLRTKFVDSISPPLIEILRDVILLDNSEIRDKKPRINAQDLFHVIDIMKKESESRTEAEEGNVHLKHLIRFLEQEYKQEIEGSKKVKIMKAVPFEMLWVFYKTDVKVWYRCELSNQQVGGIISSTQLEVELTNTGQKVLVFYITIKTVDYDGHGFKHCTVRRQIEHFKGEKNFTDLPVVPYEFSKSHGFLEDDIPENGKRFFELAEGKHFKSYNGPLLRFKSTGGCWRVEKIKADGRVMIDLQSFASMNPEYPMNNARPPSKCDMELLGEFYLKDESDYHQLAPAVVYGFSFTLKEWGQFLVLGFSDIDFDKEAFDHLVMSQDRKSILKGLVSQYGQINEPVNGTKLLDPISNKGKGCIFLCHGPPGTGKTLTAESVAEFLRQPLWIISIHELGMDPASLERQLIKILDIAFEWKAILLLDEADIYLEKRDTVDLNRNAMTGIFLRQLEYYQGILFLTTNRVTSFDDAICSRISMFFHYPKLILEERRKIWTNFICRTSLSLNSDAFIKYDLNGREIRNVLHTAQMLAKSQGNSATADDVIKIINIVQDFRGDMKKCCLEVES